MRARSTVWLAVLLCGLVVGGFGTDAAQSGPTVFSRDTDEDGDPDMLTWVERSTDGRLIRVRTLDEDDDLPAGAAQGDRDSDVYLADRLADGSVDRVVDYLDVDGDGDGDEQAIYYYRSGRPAWVWLVEDSDDDNRSWHLTNWEYLSANDQWSSDFSGVNRFALYKYEAASHKWLPYSESPFLFFDHDGDGFSDRAVRLVASDDPEANANDLQNIWKAWPVGTTMADIGIVSVRDSWDLDRDSRMGNTYDYDFGITVAGWQPYPSGRRATEGHRLGGAVPFVSQAEAQSIVGTFPAKQAALAWDETDTGARWEGVIWNSAAFPIANGGSPWQPVNVRYEYDWHPSSQRSLYWWQPDRRYHLMGADTGWLSVDWTGDNRRDYRIAYRDADRDGYFDLYTVDLGGNGTIDALEKGLGRAGRAGRTIDGGLGASFAADLQDARAADNRISRSIHGRWAVTSPIIRDLQGRAARAQAGEERRLYAWLVREHLFRYLMLDLGVAVRSQPDPDQRLGLQTILTEVERAYADGDEQAAVAALSRLGSLAASNRPTIITAQAVAVGSGGTALSYRVTRDGTVTLRVFGPGWSRWLVRGLPRSAGWHRDLWDGRDAAGRAVGKMSARYELTISNPAGTNRFQDRISFKRQQGVAE